MFIYMFIYIHTPLLYATQGSGNIIEEVETIEELEEGIVSDKIFCEHDIVVTFITSLQVWLYTQDQHGFNLTIFYQTY